MEQAISCKCGTLQGTVAHAEDLRGRRFVCYCDDCQAYAHYLGSPSEILDANGGTEVIPVFPARLRFTSGRESLKCMRLSEKGMYRWYADCCRFPIANSLSGKLGYIGLFGSMIPVSVRESQYGPVKGRIMVQFGIPPLPPDARPGTPFSLIVSTVTLIFKMLVKGLRKPSPFFDPATAEPIVKPTVISEAERADLLRRVSASIRAASQAQ